MRVLVAAATVGLAMSSCAAATTAASQTVAATRPLAIRSLQAAVVRLGSLHGRPLYGVRLRSYVCSRSAAEADRTVPTSFRIDHHVTAGRTAPSWGTPFRVVDNDITSLVPLGEARGACGHLEFEDVIPPQNYGGAESPLGSLGYSEKRRCYGVRLTLRAVLGRVDGSSPISATRRAIVQCGRFRLG